MRYGRFFSLFGDMTFWNPNKIGSEGFTVEELYQQFKKRLDEEKEAPVKGLPDNRLTVLAGKD